jgi:hypothetical protein
MVIEFDDKGKFFTDVIKKVATPAVIQTTAQRIRGSIHVCQDQRLKDELNVDEKFLAVTNATVYAPDGKELYRCKFIAVHRDQIIWAMPESELLAPAGKAGEP